MRVLLVSNVYRFSSTGQIAYLYHQELLKNGIECKMLVGIDMGVALPEDNVVFLQTKYEPMIHMYMSLLTGLEGFFSTIATKRAIKLVEEFKPDVVQLFNIHGYYINSYRFLRYLKKKKVKTVYSMLDEYPYLGRCCYAFECEKYKNGCKNCKVDRKQYPGTLLFRNGRLAYLLKKSIYSGFDSISFTGPEWVIKRARESSLLSNAKFDIVDEIVDTESMYYPRDVEAIRKELGIDEDKIVFFDACVYSDSRKGGKYYLEAAKRIADDKYIFIHVGYDGNREDLPYNYIAIPYEKNQNKLAEYFSIADCYVCTSMADTMPNACLDSLACGTPIIGFEITGVPYTADNKCGRFVKAGDVDALVIELKNTKKKDAEISAYCRNYALHRYSVKVFYEKLMNIYKREDS